MAENLASPSDYFNKRKLSPHNVNLSAGFSVLIEPRSFKNSLGEKWLLQADYRKENIPYLPPAFLRAQWIFKKNKKMESLSFFSGLRLPGTHRKTPLYFGLSLGGEFSPHSSKKMAFYLQTSFVLRLVQFHRKASVLMEVAARYRMNEAKWWVSPSSINVLTGIDFNL